MRQAGRALQRGRGICQHDGCVLYLDWGGCSAGVYSSQKLSGVNDTSLKLSENKELKMHRFGFSQPGMETLHCNQPQVVLRPTQEHTE